jgi:hypothetical protein
LSLIQEHDRYLLLSAWICALSKPKHTADKPDIRPVAIGEVLYKLAAIHTLDYCLSNESVINKLFPSIQYGYGKRGGCQRACHIIRASWEYFGSQSIVLAIDDNFVVVQGSNEE